MYSERGLHARSLWFVALAACFSAGCSSSSVEGPELNFPCVSWCNTVAPWPHDGNPYQSPNFTVYSDGASRQALIDVAEIAEGVLTDLKSRLEIPSNDLFVFPAGQTKIHLYAYKYHYQSQWGGQGFWGGMIIYSPDHPRLTALGHTERGNYTRLMTHEIAHVIQNLLVGSRHAYSTHTWFEEGLGEFVSSLNPERSILNIADLNDVIARYGELNPIAIHNDVYPAIDGVGQNYFYPMFELTMRYLLDDRGLGHSLADVKNVFLDMRDGTSFSAAFQRRFGVSVAVLQAEFFGRMRQYLD